MRSDAHTDLGAVKIHRNVIASIAGLAAMDIEGVKRVGLSPKNIFTEMLNFKSAPSVKVDFDKNDEVKVQIPLILKYDCNIPDISAKVQDNVRCALERMTNLNIKEIIINVQGIERG